MIIGAVLDFRSTTSPLKSQTFCWFLWATDQAPEVLKMLSEAAANPLEVTSTDSQMLDVWCTDSYLDTYIDITSVWSPSLEIWDTNYTDDVEKNEKRIYLGAVYVKLWEYINCHLFFTSKKMVKFEKQVESFAAKQELDLEEDADEEYPTVARWVISQFWPRDRGTLGVGWSVWIVLYG